MYIIKKITKIKKSVISKATGISAVAASLVLSSTMQFSAAKVDFAGGVQKVAEDVTSQGKTVAGIVFGAVAVFALSFTIGNAVKASMSYKKGEGLHLGAVIGGAIATIVCGLASAAYFFSWFGL